MLLLPGTLLLGYLGTQSCSFHEFSSSHLTVLNWNGSLDVSQAFLRQGRHIPSHRCVAHLRKMIMDENPSRDCAKTSSFSAAKLHSTESAVMRRLECAFYLQVPDIHTSLAIRTCSAIQPDSSFKAPRQMYSISRGSPIPIDALPVLPVLAALVRCGIQTG